MYYSNYHVLWRGFCRGGDGCQKRKSFSTSLLSPPGDTNLISNRKSSSSHLGPGVIGFILLNFGESVHPTWGIQTHGSRGPSLTLKPLRRRHTAQSRLSACLQDRQRQNSLVKTPGFSAWDEQQHGQGQEEKKIKSAVPHEYEYRLSYGWMGGNGA